MRSSFFAHAKEGGREEKSTIGRRALFGHVKRKAKMRQRKSGRKKRGEGGGSGYSFTQFQTSHEVNLTLT